MAKTKEEDKKEVEKVEHKNIYAALSAFQGEMEPLEKTKHVKFKTKSGREIEFNYTPLGEDIKETSPVLAKHGLSLRHEIGQDEGKQYIEAILTHETYSRDTIKKGQSSEAGSSRVLTDYEIVVDGEIRSGKVKISTGSDMKDTGAAITYARRYTLEMVLGIAGEDDNDFQLLADSQKNAVKFAYNRARKNIDEADTVESVEKAKKVLEDDLEQLEKGKAPALGLDKEQYDKLISHADIKVKKLQEDDKDKE